MRNAITSACLATLIVAGLSGCGEEETFEYQTHAARRGNLRISIKQKGAIEARDPVKVTNPLEGNSTILWIIPEGTPVKKGDKLFELDVSAQEERLLQQEIKAKEAAQKLLNAEEQKSIQIQQNESDIKRAELDLLFAELDLKQYLEGELPQERNKLEQEITLAEQELQRANDTYSWSQKLAAKGFISKDKLEADRLAVKRRELDLVLSKESLKLLNTYTAVKREQELRSARDEAERELARVKAKCRAALNQREGEVTSRKAQHELEVKQLERLRRQIENAVVYAPAEGIVIYGREGRGRDTKPLEERSKVWEGQEIIKLPDMSRIDVDVDVHESSVELVEVGMPVIVSTDTGEVLEGVVESIASVPDSQSWYRNPDLKVYSTKVTVDNPDGKLRPGMNCQAEIIIEELENVISIPVQAAYSNGEDTFCYVKRDGKPVLTKIEIGKHNGEMVHVLAGISEGDEVYLALPPDAEPIPLRERSSPQANIGSKSKPRGAAATNGGRESADAGAASRRRERARSGAGAPGAKRPSGGMAARFLERLPADERAKIEAMSAEERRDYFKKKFGGRRGGGRRGSGGPGPGER